MADVMHRVQAVPFVNWKTCRAHRSAARRTGVLPSFKQSAIAGPKIERLAVIAEGFACFQLQKS